MLLRRRLSLVVAMGLAGATACSLGSLRGYSGGARIDDAGAPDAAGESPGADGGGPASGTDAGDGSGQADAYRAAVLLDKPVSYWRLDERSGTRCKDEMGVHDGTYDTDVTLGAPGAVAGGTGASFELASGAIAIGNAFEFPGVQPFAFEAWILPTAAPLDGTLFTTVFFEPAAGYAPREGTTFYIHDNGVGFERWTTDLVQFTHDDGHPLSSTEWSHLVVTFDGELTTLYVNGEAASQNGPGSAMTTTPRPFAWGTMQGSFDELAVYDHVLTPLRVLTHYKTGEGDAMRPRGGVVEGPTAFPSGDS